MRVTGNVKPDEVSIERQLQSDFATVRLRENISKITITDTNTGSEIEMYQYDEYTVQVRYREELQSDIESNLQDWLTTGRTLEYNPNASAVADLAAENAAYASNMNELDASYREGVNSV